MQGGAIKSSFLLTEYLRHTKDSATANSTTGKTLLNHYYSFLMGECRNHIIEKTKYADIKANKRSMILPPDFIEMKTVRFYDGTQWHPLTFVPSMDKWGQYTAVVTPVSIPDLYTIINENGAMHLELEGIPDTNRSSALEIVYEGYHDPLYFPDDYVTGTVAITQGSAGLVGSGTTFTAAMVGRFLMITNGKYWYDLKSFTNTTNMSLVNFFQEATVSGVGYTIAELLRLPPDFQLTPMYGAVADYYRPNNQAKAKEYDLLYVRDLSLIRSRFQNKTKGRIIPGIPVRPVQGTVIPKNYPNSNIE